MNKTILNFIINALMFLCMMAIAGIGFLMKFVLLPGRESQIKYGRNVDLFFLNMDRHEWGTIHLILGFVLLGFLILHIVLHWNMIVNMYARLIRARKVGIAIAAVFIIAGIILASFPLLVNPEVQERGRGEGRSGRGEGYLEEKQGMTAHSVYRNYEH